ncbi:DeoR/GlpR family DNA-binding transcription regulator [Pectinatus haikarae]|uniref:DeoR/GlpR family transcriptional regulator of sugar metabolism n=1 Tax=Pectinatus haikarae TaxID=349096 RepID=A0ABT9YB05_9FIRM|nr:DeoR/GlpR family DNA-binding transcription regulator [Pectinatus haikarae]MDQ0204998.1 DeoR/GlpR family transcriptional regulator of sugar metabolism [Pectinatus haikarae]
MYPHDRGKQIITILLKRKFQTVTALAKQLYASESTIRRDLKTLEQCGEIERVNGGALIIENSQLERPISLTNRENIDKKKLIAELAFDFIGDNKKIFLDSSSTCFFLAKKMQTLNNLTITTNGLLTAYILSAESDSQVYCTGGAVYSKRSSVNGYHACRYIAEHNADIAFISCKGISRSGISDLKEEEAQIKRMYQQQSDRTIVLVDSTKFNKSYFCTALPFDKIDVIISDAPLPQNILNVTNKYSINIIFP